MTINPYESPGAVSSALAVGSAQQISRATRWQAVRAAAWCGAKFGFWAYMVIMVFISLASTIVVLVVPRLRTELALETLSLPQILKTAGGIIVFFVGFGILYGAIPGSIVAGTIAAVRWRRHVKAVEPPPLVS
jgi:hypothetical protein